MQVKHKASPGQQKTSWKRPDVYEQLASQTQDLSCLNDSIYVHASQVQDKKNMFRTEEKLSEKEQIEGIFLNVSIELQYTCMQVKRKTKNLCPEQQNIIWKRQDVYKQLASQMQDLSSINDSINMHASQVQEKKKYVQNSKNKLDKERMVIQSLQVKCKTCLA